MIEPMPADWFDTHMLSDGGAAVAHAIQVEAEDTRWSDIVRRLNRIIAQKKATDAGP